MSIKQLDGIKNSHELFELINEHRVKAGGKPYRNHADFVVKIKKEVGLLDAHDNVFFGRINNLGHKVQDKAYVLSRKDVYLVSMRESKEVRSSVYDHIVGLEEQAMMMKNLVWRVINNKAYLGREYALKSAGVKHPRLFMKYLRSNSKFYEDVYDRGFLKNQHVSADTKVEMFTKEGFQWLLSSVDKVNGWVETCKLSSKGVQL